MRNEVYRKGQMFWHIRAITFQGEILRSEVFSDRMEVRREVFWGVPVRPYRLWSRPSGSAVVLNSRCAGVHKVYTRRYTTATMTTIKMTTTTIKTTTTTMATATTGGGGGDYRCMVGLTLSS